MCCLPVANDAGNEEPNSRVLVKKRVLTKTTKLRGSNKLQLPPMSTVGSTLPKCVINVKWKVHSNQDAGAVGYWALTSYVRRLQVWAVPAAARASAHTHFIAIARDKGTWATWARGSLSPQNGVRQRHDDHGTFQGGFVATFRGQFNHGAHARKTHGEIGPFDFGGTRSDVLKGRYDKGQVGNKTSFDFAKSYFANVTEYTMTNWGWDYFTRDKKQRWQNTMQGNHGDIVLKMPAAQKQDAKPPRAHKSLPAAEPRGRKANGTTQRKHLPAAKSREVAAFLDD